MKSHLQITVEELREKFKNSSIWEQAETNKHSTIHSIETFLTERYKDLEEKIEGMKFLEAAFSPERLRDKQVHNRTLDMVLKLFRGETKS